MAKNSSSSSTKWEITIFSAVIFLLVVNPYTYKLTNALFSGIIGPTARNGCPTSIGLFLHTIVYILLIRYSMDLKLFS
jgi:hypothetical protein